MKMKKIVATGSALALTAAVAVGGTLAWLTANDSVQNTFTVGNIQMSMDEAPVDANGQATEGARTDANTYHIVPGGSYDKDPTIHFNAGNDASYLFVKVENGLEGIEANVDGKDTIEEQILANGWAAVDDEENVYYKAVSANTGAAAVDYVVFENLYISETASDLSAYADKTITVTAYAIQQAGFESNVAGAWDAVQAAHPTV